MESQSKMSGKGKQQKMEVRAKMLTTVHAIAGKSKSGMLLTDALTLTEKTLKQRKAKRRAQRAARKRNRK